MADMTRRDFVSGSAALAMGATVVPRRVLGGPGQQAPSDTLAISIVGAGGMGAENAQELGSERIVAVCDVDHRLVANKAEERSVDRDGNPREQGVRWKEQYAAARKYADFRVMLEQEDEVDAVLIATPRPFPRRHRRGGHAGGQARVRAEAPDLVGARGA